jgi:8-oxo-dGTP pyrophosphatase MutT (NUDIX family)
MKNYIKNIREKIGHKPIIMSGVGLIICKDNKVLLQKRADDGNWGIHGGGMELGETYLEALNRELKEEMNITPIDPKLYGIFSGKKMHHIYPNEDEVFCCEEYEGSINFNDHEVIECKWFDIQHLPNNLIDLDVAVMKHLESYLKDKQVIVD